MSSILAKAAAAFALAKSARSALAEVADAVKDSGAALTTTEREELERMMAEEREESRQARDRLNAAIDKALNP